MARTASRNRVIATELPVIGGCAEIVRFRRTRTRRVRARDYGRLRRGVQRRFRRSRRGWRPPEKSKAPVSVIQRNGQRVWCRYLSANRTTGPSSRDKQSPCPLPPEQSGGSPRCPWKQPSWPLTSGAAVISRSWRERRKGEGVRFTDATDTRGARAKTARGAGPERSCGAPEQAGYGRRLLQLKTQPDPIWLPKPVNRPLLAADGHVR